MLISIKNPGKQVHCEPSLKKLTAILLLAVFLVNLVGYRGWFYLAEQQWNKEQQTSLDHSLYNEDELITIRVPLRLPYVSDTKEFKRTDGEIKVNGHIYRYVKSKIENGQYVLLCLPDHYKQRLEIAKQDYYRLANDTDQNTDTKKTGSSSLLLKLQLSDYEQCYLSFTALGLHSLQPVYFFTQDKRVVSSPHLSPAQPPDVI